MDNRGKYARMPMVNASVNCLKKRLLSLLSMFMQYGNSNVTV